MSDTIDIFDVSKRQVGTTEQSATAMLDTETERRLYVLYREFFQIAEDNRNWNLWLDIPWEGIVGPPNPELAAAVFGAFREDLFLPDYASKSLHILRASRGRAWFWTRWTYEEGKHLLTWIEWLTRSGAYPDEDLRKYADEQLVAYRWEPPVGDAAGIFWDTLLWEEHEVARANRLLTLATDAQDAALIDAMTKILRDEESHRDFIRQALRIIRESQPERVLTAAEKVAAANEISGGADSMLRHLD